MSLNIWNLEWLNHNSQRSYPIADWASRECNLSSDIKLPNDFILALSLSVNSAHNIEIDKFYIKAVAVMGKCCVITIGYEEDEQDVAEITIYTDSIQDTYAFIGTGTFDDARGYIGINRNSIIFNELAGYFTFAYEATAIEPDCIRNTSKMLSAIQINKGRESSPRSYGGKTFVGKDNIKLEAYISDDVTTIIINGVDDSIKDEIKADENDECIPRFAKKVPITSINGVKPDKDGNIEIEGSNSAKIRKIGNGIKIEDAFAEPCCECEELDELYGKLNELIAQYSPMKALASDIDARQQLLDEGGNSCAVGNTCNCVIQNDEEEPEEDPPVNIDDGSVELVYYIKVAYRDLMNASSHKEPFADALTSHGTHSFTRETDNAELHIGDETFIIDAFSVDNGINLFDTYEQLYDGYRRLVIPWPTNSPSIPITEHQGFYDPDLISIPGVKFKAYWHYKYSGDSREMQYILDNNGSIPKDGVASFSVYRMELTEFNKKYASSDWQVKYR